MGYPQYHSLQRTRTYSAQFHHQFHEDSAISPPIDILIMPFEVRPVRHVGHSLRHTCKPPSMKLVVLPSILKFLLYPTAYLHLHLLGHRDVPRVKEFVNVRSDKQAIRYEMRTGRCIRLYVSRFQRRQRPLPVMAHRLLYASVTSTRKAPCPSLTRVKIILLYGEDDVSSNSWLFPTSCWSMERYFRLPFLLVYDQTLQESLDVQKFKGNRHLRQKPRPLRCFWTCFFW
jgi:hypothetical protein